MKWTYGPSTRNDPSTKVNVPVPAANIRGKNSDGEIYLSRSDLMLWMTEFAEAMEKAGASWIAADAIRGVRDQMKAFKVE